jgi:branched-chain amino acid transport system permease protein
MNTRIELSKRTAWSDWGMMAILAAVLLAMPLALPSAMMGAEILIMAIPVLSFILLLGYGGQLSFCTGALFAIGAYTTGILMARYHIPILPSLLSGVLLTGLSSALVGYLCNRQTLMLIFSLLTLAFNQLIWFIIFQWASLTGGADGLVGIDRSNLNFGLFQVDLGSKLNFYLFVLIIFLVVFVFAWRLIQSPFGKVLQALRESELRCIAIGYNPMTYKWVSFIITGMICGLGGGLFALHQGYVGEHLAYWTTSGDICVMALLGGTFSIYGAILGSALFIILSDLMNSITVLSQTGGWLFFLGIIFIIVVLFFQGGLLEGIEKGQAWLRRRAAAR